jgi:CxxC-x17-CxxC domain-containing protein
MKKEIKHNVVEMIMRIQEQLVSLERKIDTLNSRYPGRSPAAGQHTQVKHEQGHRERTMYKAICADCNKECEVPFRPSQDRPVYCKDCFSSRKGGGSFKASRDSTPAQGGLSPQSPFYKFQAGKKHKFSTKEKPLRKGAKSKRKMRR